MGDPAGDWGRARAAHARAGGARVLGRAGTAVLRASGGGALRRHRMPWPWAARGAAAEVFARWLALCSDHHGRCGPPAPAARQPPRAR